MRFDHDNFRAGEKLVINVGGGMDGQRLDNYLCSRFSHLSRAKMQRIIKNQQILVNGQRAKPSRRVYVNDRVEFYLPSSEILAQQMPLEVLYEDDDIIAINKQPGIIIHPARGNSDGTLLNALMGYADGKFMPDVVHRLDRDTSGVIIFSKNAAANAALSEQFQNRTAEKRYIAIATGRVEALRGKIELAIGEIPFTQRYGVADDGKYALTYYNTLFRCKDYSVVEVDLQTGRTHQIRVHFSHIGNPLIADTLYGGKPLAKLTRCALHAARLRLQHPTKGEALELEAPLPEDMKMYRKKAETAGSD